MEKQEEYDVVEAREIDEVRAEEIDLDQLVWLMLNWGKVRRQLTEIEEAIKDTVLVLGKTQTVGTVRATYSKPRSKYDYEGPIRSLLASKSLPETDRDLLEQRIALYTEPSTNWRKVCERENIKPIVTPGEGPGSVTLKLLK